MISWMLPIIYLAFFSMGLPDGMIGAAWPSMYTALNVPVSYAGYVTVLITAGTVLSALCSNALISRFGTWTITVGSTLLTVVALLGFALAPSFGWVCACAVPLGLGAGSIDAVLNRYVALHGTSRQMSWIHVAWGVGATGGPCLIAWVLLHGFPWQGGYWTVAALQGVMAVLLFISRPCWKHDATASSAEGSPMTTWEALRLPGMGFALAGLFAMQGLEFCAGIWAGSYLHLVGGVTPEEAAKWAALFYGGMTVGRFLSGFVADRIGDKNMIRWGAGCVVAGAILLLFPATFRLIQVGLLLVGLGAAPLFPCFLHATPERFGVRASQAAMGLQMACAYTGAALMPLVLGWVVQGIAMSVYPCFLLGFILTMTVLLEQMNVRCKRP